MGEKKSLKFLGKTITIFLISVSLAALIVFFYYQDKNVIRSVESASLNLRFAFKIGISGNYLKNSQSSKTGIYDRLVLGAIEDSTIEAYGGSFPFNRSVWADTLNTINQKPLEKMPALVFFDIFFADKSENAESDKALIEAFKNYKGVLGEDFIFDNIHGIDINIQGEEKAATEALKDIYLKECLPYTNEKVQALKKFELHFKNSFKTLNFPKVTPLLPELSESLKFVGVANIVEDENIYRMIPLIVSAKYVAENNSITNIYYPSIVLAITTKLLHSDISNIIVEKGFITIKNADYNGQKMDFKIPVDSINKLSVNYQSYPGTGYIKTIPFRKLAEAKLKKDAVVFVGMYSKKGTHDIWYSPIGDMFGVEHLAYAVATIMNRDFISSVPDWINIIYIFAMALFIGFLTSFGSRQTSIAGILSIALPLLIGFAFFQFNWKIITAVPILTCILILVTVQIFMLLTEGKEKKFIKSTFSSYLNPKLVDILINNPDMIQLGGQDKEVTVFFSATKGLENIADNIKPKEIIEYLNIYFTRMADIVMDTSGTLDKYMGDTVMAFWGAPLDLPDHALKACQAAVKMMEALQGFNEDQAKKGYKPISINIGINTGNIIVGNVGSEQQKNYTAIGDSVNLASRIKGLNKFFHTNIVISEFTYDQVKEWVVARELDLTKVKGKTKPVRIYELLDVTKRD
jgi:adenylate cyclase